MKYNNTNYLSVHLTYMTILTSFRFRYI